MKTEHGAQERRRELNRLAAQKLRNRQKERALNIRQEYFNAQSSNTRLVYEKKQLYKEKEMLRMSLETHMQFCQQQRPNLLIGSRVICLTSPTAAFSQPIFITNIDQTTSGRASLSSSEYGSRSGVEDAEASCDTQSSVDECQEDDNVHNDDHNLQTLEVEVNDENTEGDVATTLVIADDAVQQNSIDVTETEEKMIDSNKLTVANEKSDEHDSSSHSCIPVMVLDMNESSET